MRRVEDIPGCNDSQACNYLETATSNDGAATPLYLAKPATTKTPTSSTTNGTYGGNCLGWESNVDPTVRDRAEACKR